MGVKGDTSILLNNGGWDKVSVREGEKWGYIVVPFILYLSYFNVQKIIFLVGWTNITL